MCRYKGLIVLLLLLAGLAPAFSAEILTSFAAGYESTGWVSDEGNSENYSGITGGNREVSAGGGLWAVNALFVGRSGMTISAGAEFFSTFGEYFIPEIVLGLGYINYNILYWGAVFNVIPRKYNDNGYNSNNEIDLKSDNNDGDGIIAPTVVVGMDFSAFLLEARLSYLHGFRNSLDGWRFTLGVGINAGESW